MWDTSGFDNAGGFMNGSQDFNSPSKPKKDQVRRVQSVVPLVARQVQDFDEDDFKLFGTPIQIANIVGVLRHFDMQSTKVSCTIEDHTGCVKAILWLENQNETLTDLPPVKEGCYVQVFGLVRNQDGEKIVMILKMFPLEDSSIITNHLLQVIHARLAAEANSKGVSMGAPLANSNTTMSLSDVNMGTTTTIQNNHGLTKMQEKIFQLLQAAGDNPAGVSREVVLKSFSPGQAREVNDALDFLLNEGHAYSTINNDHFKATDSM